MKNNLKEQQVFAPLQGKPGFKDLTTGKWTELNVKASDPSKVQAKLNQYATLRGKDQLLKDVQKLSSPSTTQQEPSPPPPLQSSTTSSSPRAQAPTSSSIERRVSPVTGRQTYIGTTSSGQKFERRAATRAELDAARKAREEALKSGKSRSEAEKAAVAAGISAPKTQKEEKMDAFDLVLEYLTSEGHVDTLDEALYVMMEMDSECIQSICEGYQTPRLKRKHYLKKLSKRGGMGTGAPGDPLGYRDPKMAKVGAEFVARTTAARRAQETGEPDTYQKEREEKAAANRARGAAKRGEG